MVYKPRSNTVFSLWLWCGGGNTSLPPAPVAALTLPPVPAAALTLPPVPAAALTLVPPAVADITAIGDFCVFQFRR